MYFRFTCMLLQIKKSNPINLHCIYVLQSLTFNYVCLLLENPAAETYITTQSYAPKQNMVALRMAYAQGGRPMLSVTHKAVCLGSRMSYVNRAPLPVYSLVYL